MTVSSYSIRRAEPAELARLPELERAAARRFVASSHPHAAEMPPLDVDTLEAAHAAAGVWVVVAGDALVGFVAVEPMGADRFVLELDVHPGHAGHGLGARLLEAAATDARNAGATRLLLRTFVDVPWNAPYYARLGFVALAEHETPPEVCARVVHERAVGLDPARRLTMARVLG